MRTGWQERARKFPLELTSCYRDRILENGVLILNLRGVRWLFQLPYSAALHPDTLYDTRRDEQRNCKPCQL
ncbi:MAG: hypothetical protein AAFY26_00020 [Cyanobacteria bacterium J06638_22]